MKIVFKLLVILILCSCGFSPLYLGSPLSNQVFVNAIPEAEGQRLRFELREKLSPAGFPENPKYYLNVRLERRLITDQAVRDDATSSRHTIHLTANVVLQENNDKREVIFKDNFYILASYDILSMPYSTVASEQTTTNNMITTLASRIALRIDVFLKNKETDEVE